MRAGQAQAGSYPFRGILSISLRGGALNEKGLLTASTVATGLSG